MVKTKKWEGRKPYQIGNKKTQQGRRKKRPKKERKLRKYEDCENRNKNSKKQKYKKRKRKLEKNNIELRRPRSGRYLPLILFTSLFSLATGRNTNTHQPFLIHISAHLSLKPHFVLCKNSYYKFKGWQQKTSSFACFGKTQIEIRKDNNFLKRKGKTNNRIKKLGQRKKSREKG